MKTASFWYYRDQTWQAIILTDEPMHTPCKEEGYSEDDWYHDNDCRCGGSAQITNHRAVLEWQEGGPHEEGFSYMNTRFYIEDDYVIREVDTRSRDCDGPHESSRIWRCHVNDLAGQVKDFNPDWDNDNGSTVRIMVPKWENTHDRQRDYFAEAAGY